MSKTFDELIEQAIKAWFEAQSICSERDHKTQA